MEYNFFLFPNGCVFISFLFCFSVYVFSLTIYLLFTCYLFHYFVLLSFVAGSLSCLTLVRIILLRYSYVIIYFLFIIIRCLLFLINYHPHHYSFLQLVSLSIHLFSILHPSFIHPLIYHPSSLPSSYTTSFLLPPIPHSSPHNLTLDTIPYIFVLTQKQEVRGLGGEGGIISVGRWVDGGR